MHGQQVNDLVIVQQAQKAVDQLGLQFGRMSMDVHESNAQHVDIYERFPLNSAVSENRRLTLRHTTSRGTAAADCTEIALLKQVVVEHCGPFSHLEIRVKDGTVEIVKIGRKIKGS